MFKDTTAMSSEFGDANSTNFFNLVMEVHIISGLDSEQLDLDVYCMHTGRTSIHLGLHTLHYQG
jgi:hypothetical protein